MVIVYHVIEVAIFYILQHELAHIWNGHIGMLSEHDASAEFVDGLDASPDFEHDPRLYALEMDADKGAIHATLMRYARLDMNGSWPALKYDANTVLPGLDIYLQGIGFALITAFNLMHVALQELRPIQHAKKHPAISLRKSWAMDALIRAFYGSENNPDLDVVQIIRSASRGSAFGLADAFGLDRKVAIERLCASPLTLLSILDDLKDLQPELRRFMRGERLMQILSLKEFLAREG